MRRAKKRALIVALIFMAIGIVLSVMGLSMMKFNIIGAFDMKYTTRIHHVTEDFSSINIDINVADITFIVSPDGKSRVECYENDKRTHTVGIEGGALTIREQRKFNVFDFISFGFSKPRVTLYLSRTDFDTLIINSDTSLIVVPQEFSFNECRIDSRTGDVSYRATTVGALDIKVTTGRLMVSDISPASIKLKSDTGHVTLSSVKATGDIEIKASTGRIYIENVECGNLSLKNSTGSKTLTNVKCQNLAINCTTGDTELKNIECQGLTHESDTGDVDMSSVIASGKFDIETSTGRVTLDGCDAANINIETDTGNVKGTLLSEKIFYAESNTGRIKVPHGASGGICEVQTDTGSITFTIEQ